MAVRRIGVDLGGVVINGRAEHADTMFGENYLRTPEVTGAFDALRTLTTGGHEVFIVSKCGSNVEAKSRHWLDERDFYARTGVRRDAVRFCRKRPQKATIATELCLDAFVDDRWDVAAVVEPLVRTTVVFDPAGEPDPSLAAVAGRVARVSTWEQALTALTS